MAPLISGFCISILLLDNSLFGRGRNYFIENIWLASIINATQIILKNVCIATSMSPPPPPDANVILEYSYKSRKYVDSPY
jgi:hypothetical protein